jgi:disulfide bond formation protein DsbB
MQALLNKIAGNDAKLFFVMMLAIATLTLIFALVAEYMGFAPCPLCIYQRLPYALIIAVSILALSIKKLREHLALLLILAQVTSILLSAYHSAIEFGWIDPLDTCSGTTDYSKLSLDEIKNHINDAPIANCAVPSVVIFGLSMAQWNFIFNIFLIAVSIPIFRRLCQSQNSNPLKK